MRGAQRTPHPLFLVFAVLSACDRGSVLDAATLDVTVPVDASDVHSSAATFCALPGATPAWLQLPPGFCARTFGNVQHARVIRFAPGGELFVASPNTPTAGYGGAGPAPSRIAYVADDDGDGIGDGAQTFIPNLDSCHALLFAPGTFYYSVGTAVLEMPYVAGQRTPVNGVMVADLDDGASFMHWPHTMDLADDGTVYVSRGGDESSVCPPMRPVRGAVFALNGTLQARVVAQGLRNPMYVRCHAGSGRCYANELTGDFWDAVGGTEKLITIRDGDDWGYPCCVTLGEPAPDAGADCSAIASGDTAIALHDTPFGMDFEPGAWPAPWRSSVIVALHGAFTTWAGTRVVAVATDPLTGAPLPTATPADFATGWDDGTMAHGRPADVTFARDGRLFVANDITGEILWIAPTSLARP